MGTLVGIILVVLAAGTIIGVLWVVMQEKHTPEEYYIPPARTDKAEAPASVRDMVAENAGTEMQPSPTIEREEQEHRNTQA
jgi:hypothetical protein